MSYLTVKQSLFASFAFAVGLLLLALVILGVGGL